MTLIISSVNESKESSIQVKCLNHNIQIDKYLYQSLFHMKTHGQGKTSAQILHVPSSLVDKVQV